MVVAYRMAALSYAMIEKQGLPAVGGSVPTSLRESFWCPNFCNLRQHPGRWLNALSFQLDDQANRAQLKLRFTEMHLQLRCNTAERSANAVAEFLDRHRT